ncbi:hypothetical protein STRCI_008674, partial [Streptomyces cinnabarinus]
VCSADTTRRRYAAVQLPCSARQLMDRHSVTVVQIAPRSERRNSLREFLKSGWLGQPAPRVLAFGWLEFVLQT